MDILEEVNNLLSEKEFAKAKNKILQAIAEQGEDTEKVKLLGLININLDCIEEAKQNFETVTLQEKKDATSWFYLGNCYEKLNLLEEAKNAYVKVIVLRENYIEAYKSLCMIYISTKEEEKAIEVATQAKEIDSEDYVFDYFIGTAQLALKNYKQAILALEDAIKLNPNHAQIYGNLGTAYLLINNYILAFEMYNKSIELDDKNPDTLYNLGSLLQIQNNHSEACSYFEKAYDLKNDEKILVALALSESKSGNIQKAIEHYKLLATTHPEKDSYQYNLATCYEQVRDYPNAITLLKQLLTRNPKSLTMAQKLAGMYVDSRDLRSAKEIYDSIILKLSPTANVLYQYAIISSQLCDTDTAERIFKKVLKMNPDNATAHKDLGVIYLNKRLFNYAEDEFKTALKLEPKSYEIVLEYANYLYSVAKFKEADEYYSKALEIEDSVIAKTLKAITKIDLNELDEAKKLIDEAIKQEPHHEYIQFMAGRVYFSLKDYETAKRYLIHSIEQNPDVESKNILALTYFGLEEYQNANNIFESLLKVSPQNISLLYNSAQCYEKLGLPDKALERLYTLTDIFPEHEDAQEMIRKLS